MSTSRLFRLDEDVCTDTRVAGGKAALLSRARSRGFPVLTGLVVPAQVSRRYLDVGAAALRTGGSGRARMAVTEMTLEPDLADELSARSRQLGERLVVRSSGVHEADGTWSGAFSSFLEIRPDEIARAVIGCWASTFTVAAIDRHVAAGIEPGSMDMAVLIQPEITPEFAGTARAEDGVVSVGAIAGSPAPLVSGWDPGSFGKVEPDGTISGSAVDLIGASHLLAIADLIRSASALGATGCEWAIFEGVLHLLQLVTTPTRTHPVPVQVLEGLDTDAASRVSRLARRFPGSLGEDLVLPWALGCADLPEETAPYPIDPVEALHEVSALSAGLVAEVWPVGPGEAADVARDTLRQLRGPNPQSGLERLTGLKAPDPAGVTAVLSRLATVRRAMMERGAVTWPESAWHLDRVQIERTLAGTAETEKARIGFDRWDPFNIGVVFAKGTPVRGLPTSGGLGFGRARWIGGLEDMKLFRPREVIAARHPTPDLAPLLWDAAAVITSGGNPGAHLFESARALGLPAVSSVNLEEVLDSEHGVDSKAVAVDGSNGIVSIDKW